MGFDDFDYLLKLSAIVEALANRCCFLFSLFDGFGILINGF